MPNKILIVDDEPFNLDLLEQELGDQGYVIERAADGAEALEKVPSFEPDVILLDYMMPRMNGLEVLKQIKSDVELRIIPVVVLTSSKEEKDMVASYKLGVNAYVVKPVDFHEFVNAIKELGVFWAVINEPPPGSVRK